MSAVEAIEVAEVEKASIFGVSGDEDLLINALSQAASGSQTSSNAGEMNLIDQGSQNTAQRMDIPHGGFRPVLFSAGDANSHGTEFHIHQKFINMEE